MHHKADSMVQKARLLINQSRLRDAERELGKVLSAEPNNDEALGLLAQIKIDEGHATEALALLGQALTLNPEEDYYIYLRGFAHYKLDANASALADLDAALAMNPYNPGYFSLYAYVLIDERRFAEALEKANEGLRLNAEDVACLNARSRALIKMGKVGDAESTMQNSLAADPENDWTHTNVAWNFLERGEHKKAAHHFQEALRINPSNGGAVEGMKEALKSRIAPYRWFLRYGIWLSAKGKNMQWMMAVGLYLCFRVASAVAGTLPSPFNAIVYALIGLYILAVITSWLITPIANAFLSVHPQGRYALTVSERISSQTAVLALLLGLVLGLVALFSASPRNEGLVSAAFVLASLALPLGLLQYPIGKGYKPIQWVTLALVIVGFSAVSALLLGFKFGLALAGAYLAALVIGSWVRAFRR